MESRRFTNPWSPVGTSRILVLVEPDRPAVMQPVTARKRIPFTALVYFAGYAGKPDHFLPNIAYNFLGTQLE